VNQREFEETVMANIVITRIVATTLDPAPIRRRNQNIAARTPRASQGILAGSVFCLAAFLYALAVGFDLPVPRLEIEHDPALGFGLDLLLLAGFVAHFHFVQQRGMVPVRAAQLPQISRLALALVQAGCIAVLFFALWQPLPQAVWQVAAPLAATLLWLGYGAGWLLLLGKAHDPKLLLVGVCLVEWSAPGMTLGHLVFAIGLTAFAAAYREALAQLALGDLRRWCT
jgi:preprotein translocase subunit SecY